MKEERKQREQIQDKAFDVKVVEEEVAYLFKS